MDRQDTVKNYMINNNEDNIEDMLEQEAQKIVTIYGKKSYNFAPWNIIYQVYSLAYKKYKGWVFGLSAVYVLGYIQGKKDERARRRKSLAGNAAVKFSTLFEQLSKGNKECIADIVEILLKAQKGTANNMEAARSSVIKNLKFAWARTLSEIVSGIAYDKAESQILELKSSGKYSAKDQGLEKEFEKLYDKNLEEI